MAFPRGSIDNGETVNHIDDGDIHITGKISRRLRTSPACR